MRRTYTHFERVPVEVAEKILEQQNIAAKRGGDRKRVVKKSERTANGLHPVPEKAEVLVP
jgi:hypothetical protein